MSNRDREILRLSAQIVAAHVGHNETVANTLSATIHRVYNTLLDLYDANSHAGTIQNDHFVSEHRHHHHDHGGDHDGHSDHGSHDDHAHVHPAVGQTVFDDHLICLEDGLSMKMLKRHLLTVHGMTPEEYRAKWNLPDDYPMVASQYAKLRSNLAVQSGLGLKPQDRPASSGSRRGKASRKDEA
jgi:predicted transcriptional regulator